ncbi:Histone cluster 1 [Cichlidogyrus casuarinus]|uniref:Histone cluster 1 n=1 Tax=Cichlidogyrus casuarinus TaxID=1844966 RepID=A0ABD2Q7T6_9PLAT
MMSVTMMKTKSTKPRATHPPTIDMVNAAIESVPDQKGVALASIKKYIAANYKFDVVRNSLFIRKALIRGLEKGQIVRVGNKGKGASGSFKLANKVPKVKKSPKKPKASKEDKPKTPKKDKPKTPKKDKPKSPKKEKPAKSATESAKEPKASKPKKLTPVKKAESKKPTYSKTKKTAAPKK